MNVCVVYFILIIVTVVSSDRNRLKVRPIEMENLDLKKLMGTWYLYAQVLPCSWNGASQFKDWIYTQRLDSDGQGYTIHSSWRKDGTCTSTTAKATKTSTASAIIRDQIGDLWTGRNIVLCMDYRNYVITWGCAKESVNDGVCDDPYVSVKTRNTKISQKYIDEIQRKLHQLWGLSLSEMVLIPHNNPLIVNTSIYPKDSKIKTHCLT